MIWWCEIFALVVAAAGCLAWMKKKKRADNLPSLPPGPRRLPVVGSLAFFMGIKFDILIGRLLQRYGPLVYCKIGSLTIATTNSPEIAKEVLVTQDAAFASRAEMINGKLLTFNFSGLVFTPFGKHWKLARKLFTEALHAKNLQSFEKERQDDVERLVERIRLKSRACELIKFREVVFDCTINMVSRIAFGNNAFLDAPSEDSAQLKEILFIVNQLLVPSIGDFFPFTSRFDLDGSAAAAKNTKRKIEQFMESQLRKCKQDDSESFLKVLMNYRDEKGEPLPIDKINLLVMDALSAGAETTAKACEWVMAELLRNPRVLRKVKAEVDSVDGDVRESMLGSLHYLNATVRESLRLHPSPTYLSHRSMEETKVGGYEIPKGTIFIIDLSAVGHNPKVWERADEFLPERFVKDIEASRSVTQDMRMPVFGMGRRSCPGSSLALIMVQLILANLLKKFDWKANVAEIDMDKVEVVVNYKKNALMLTATEAHV